MKTPRKYLVVRILLMTMLVITTTMVEIPVEAAPSGFQLPFSGYAQISQGPRCAYSHYRGIDLEAIDFVFPTLPNGGLGKYVYASESGWAQVFPNSWPGGNMVKIYHPNGLTSIYAHLLDFGGLNYSGWVNKGQWIGRVGRSGSATGVHLHFAVVRTSDQKPIPIYDFPNLIWWERNPATQWCILNNRNEGEVR